MTKTNEEIQDILRESTDSYLVHCATDLTMNIIPEDSPLRELESECFDDGQFLVHILGLGCMISYELGRRLEQRNSELINLKQRVMNIL